MPRIDSVEQFRAELILAGRSRFGRPFLHHFKPDLCKGGEVTADTCWDRGLDDNGYDCSGFVIASICDVFGVETDVWPKENRHLRQMVSTADTTLVPQPGDVIFTHDPTSASRKHMGIYTGSGRMLHADGRIASPYINESIVDVGSQISVMRSTIEIA